MKFEPQYRSTAIRDVMSVAGGSFTVVGLCEIALSDLRASALVALNSLLVPASDLFKWMIRERLLIPGISEFVETADDPSK